MNESPQSRQGGGPSREYLEEFARLSLAQRKAELEFLALALQLLLEKRAREGKSLLAPEAPRSWN